jgi:enamine deaminase RidA (YjgF/YER057c/UK114 family)
MKRTNISSGSKWEDIVGYSRAVRVGNVVEVAGTTAVDDAGNVVGINDLYAQTAFVLQKIEHALIEAGATFQDVVRTRAYVTDISKWEAFGKAHGEVFKLIKPVATLVEIKALIDPKLMVEIEVTAVLNG